MQRAEINVSPLRVHAFGARRTTAHGVCASSPRREKEKERERARERGGESNKTEGRMRGAVRNVLRTVTDKMAVCLVRW